LRRPEQAGAVAAAGARRGPRGRASEDERGGATGSDGVLRGGQPGDGAGRETGDGQGTGDVDGTGRRKMTTTAREIGNAGEIGSETARVARAKKKPIALIPC
jgi:hypothetical protein